MRQNEIHFYNNKRVYQNNKIKTNNEPNKIKITEWNKNEYKIKQME